MKSGLLAGLAIFGAAMSADAATLSLTIVVNGPNATAITCPVSGTLTVPLSAGTVICPITVSPSNWSGTLSLSGTNASAFAISSGGSQSLVVGSTAITTPGSLSVTINAAP